MGRSAGTTTNDAPGCIWWPTTPGSAGWDQSVSIRTWPGRALALNLARLSADWRARYGHPIVRVESFVDREWFRGTAYKASGWKAVGPTAGFKRVAQDFYEAHQRPKQLFVRELVKHAARGLRARTMPAHWGAQERPIQRQCLLEGDRKSVV